jgi:hypothetical protein
MRTEEDLRVVLATRENRAPDPHLVLAAARQIAVVRRRRQAAGTAVAAAVAVGLLLALPGLVRRSAATAGAESTASATAHPTAHPTVSDGPATATTVATGSRPPFAFTVSRGPADGVEVWPMAVNPGIQLAKVRVPGEPRVQATLYVYQPGSSERAGWDIGRDPVPVPVNGARAWYSTDRTASSAIRWAYTPGGWAVITQTSAPALPEETMIRLAQGVRFTTPYPARLPYRLSYLPAGLKPFHAVQQTDSTAPVRSSVQLSGGGLWMDITVIDGSAQRRPGWQPNTTFAGRPTQCTDPVDGQRCVVDLGAFTVDLGMQPPDRTELAKLVAGMTFADWRAPTSWYEISVALPDR